MDGGIITASDAEDEVTAAAKAAGYPFFFIAGIKMDPSAATSATAEPEISAKNMEVATLIILRPPLTKPTKAEAKAINLLEIPEVFIIAPAKINKGIAIRGKFLAPLYIIKALSTKKLVPLFKIIAIIVVTANPTAIGTLITNNNNKMTNIPRTIMLYPP
jgi:hypothetical protein